MQQQVEGEGPEVEEGGEEAPVLVLEEDGADGVEESERGHDVALDEDGDGDGAGGPDARADGHLVEPLLEREVVGAAAGGEGGTVEHVGHGGGCFGGGGLLAGRD